MTFGCFEYIDERWDGKGALGAKGDEIPLAIRIAHVAQDIDAQRVLGGPELAARVVGERAGKAFDPEVAARFADQAKEMLAVDDEASVWEQTLASEPNPRSSLEGAAIDRALSAMGNFADLVSPYLAGHSAGVAECASAAAQRYGLDPAGVTAVRRAAFVHDVGRVAVPIPIWHKEGPLSAGEWERVRLHPYYSERVLSRSPFLACLAPVATAHHERLDGSGYPRGLKGEDILLEARIVAVADAVEAMLAQRPHRAPLTVGACIEELQAQAGRRYDARAVKACVKLLREGQGTAPAAVQPQEGEATAGQRIA